MLRLKWQSFFRNSALPASDMASEKTDAIVIRVFTWSETSCIATMLTRDFGRISAVAKGARRLKSPFEAALDLLAVCRIVFIPKSHDALDILTEAKLTRRFRSGSIDLLRLYCGYYVAELLLTMTEPGQTLKELYDLTDATLRGLDEGQPTGDVVLRFELQALRILGLQPSFQDCAACGSSPCRSSIDPGSSQSPHPELIAFSVAAGGVLCSNCLPGQRQIMRLHRETMVAMDLFSQPSWQERSLDHVPDSVRGEVRGCITRYLTTVLDKRLQMHSLIEDLAR